MASAYSLDEEKELLLSRYKDINWVDDVSEFQCVRCDKVLIRHYIANCGHKFCLNCKKVLDDGSKRWRCPLKECNKFIEDIHLQDVFFEETVFELRAHCPNHKYGCPVIGPLKDIGGHLRKCVDTRENALPVLLDQSKCLDSAFVIKQLAKLNEKMESFGSTLNDMQKATEEERLAQERKWEEMERKWVRSDKENKELVQQLKCEFQSELKTNQSKAESEMENKWKENNRKWAEHDKMWTEHDRKWADDKEMVNSVVRSFKDERKKREEVTLNVDKNASQLATLNVKVESLGKDLRGDLQNQVFKPMSKFNERLETMSLALNEMKKATKEEKLMQERKWVEHEKNYNETTERLEMEMSLLSIEMSALNEKSKETEVSKTRVKEGPSPAQEVFNSVIKPELQHLRRVGEYYKEKADFTWIVSHVNSFINESKKVLFSEVFPLTGYPFGARATIQLIGDRVRFSLCYKPRNKSNAKEDIEVKVNPRIYFTVKDQSKGKERKDRITTTTFYYYNKFEFNRDYEIERYVAKSLINSPLYLVNDKWMMDIHVEAPEVAQSVYSHDGTLTWAIDDFRKRKQMEVDGLIWYHASPYFYTSAKGYRVQVEAYLNGCSGYKNQGVSIYVALLNGVYDEDHEDYLKYKTTVTIFHPTQPHTNISKSRENNSVYGNAFDMGIEAEIESFVLNDTLYYKVTVEEIKR